MAHRSVKIGAPSRDNPGPAYKFIQFKLQEVSRH